MRTPYLLLTAAFIQLLVAASTHAASKDVTAEPEFLDPEQAFKLKASADSDAIHLIWRIEEGYYLVRSRFAIATQSPGVVLGNMVMPKGKIKADPYFGEVEVYRQQVPIEVAVEEGGGDIVLAVRSQGCADAGLCYPPSVRQITVRVPPRAVAASTKAGANMLAPTAGATIAQSTTTWATTARATPTVMPVMEPLPAGGDDATGLSLGQQSPVLPQSGIVKANFDGVDTGGGAFERLGAALGFGGVEPEFLDPQVAFVLQTVVIDGTTVEARWRVVDDYYLYRDKIKVAIKDSPGVSLDGIGMAPGTIRTDEFFGDVPVFYGEAVARINLRRMAASAPQVNLKITYQGCAEAGLCYPPIHKQFTLELPPQYKANPVAGSLSASPSLVPVAVAATLGAGSVQAAPVAEQDQLQILIGSGQLLGTILTFFAAGLLLALTPCVFPMIPILSSLIMGAGENCSRARGFALSFIYVQGMALTYTLAGIAAGLADFNLQIALQNAWVLAASVAVFIALALSMFGFYDLQVPASLQSKLTELSNKQRGGSFIGVAIMGVLSALIVGPCIAPPLFAAVAYISSSQDPVLGGFALYTLAMGMGVPLLLVGLSAGQLLPRVGAWMEGVKVFFGVVLLGVAITFLERGLLPQWATMLLWAALFIVTAIYMGALDVLEISASGWRRFWKGLGLVGLVYGGVLVVGAASGNGDPLRPLVRVEQLDFKLVKGLEGLRAAVAQANAAGKPAMLDYYADWCVSCKTMEREVFTDPGVRAALGGVELLKTDVTAWDETDTTLTRHFGLQGPPTIQFFGLDGGEKKAFRIVGEMDAPTFHAHVLRTFGS
ncbi:MAG: protein-disulfide reductase DsbD [Gammaproteobacteria bacterium]|nr:protein-disulfide reductase DsbD [Gammaproteobacteria bacterium]